MKAAFLAIGLLSGCAEPAPADPLPPPGDAFVRFDLGDAPMRLGAVPWPSELYRDANGRIALGEIDNPYSSEAMLTATRELLASRDGFCTTCNAVFEIEGGLIPPDPSDAPTLDDAFALVDVDPDSPEHGRTFPLRMQWDEGAGRLSLRPARGSTLAGHRRYAFVATDAARGADDLPMGPAPAFAEIRDGNDDVLEPTLAELEALGLPRARVRGLAAFTTEDPTADLRAIRSVVRTGPPATAIVDRVFIGDAIDDLLGVPESDRPGIDVRPAAGIEGTSSIRHATTAIVIAGRFPAPRFVEGSGTDVGATTRDASGSPIAARVEDVPFVLIVPRDADLRRLPVVVAHHGFNASRITGFALADTAGHAGFAVLAIDAYQHGDRAASATDAEHAMRNLDGPDGFAETVPLDISARVFGLLPPDPALTLFPGYPLGAFEQFAADAMAAVRFVVDGDLSSLRAADPILAELAFDRERIAYLGNSMGAVVGTSIATIEPDVRAVVLDVMPGSIMETLAESGEFRPLSETLLMPRIGVDEDFDEIERAMLFDPTVDLFRWVLEPVDPLALARSLVHERVAGSPPHLLVQLAGHDEVASPPASESVLAAAGIPAQGELAFAPVEPIVLPLEDAPAIAAIRFEGAMHGMYEVAQQTSRYAAPLDVPLVLVDSPVVRTNPIDAVHVQIETFLASFASGGPVVIVP